MNGFLHSLALQTCNSVGIKSFPFSKFTICPIPKVTLKITIANFTLSLYNALNRNPRKIICLFLIISYFVIIYTIIIIKNNADNISTICVISIRMAYFCTIFISTQKC